MSKEVQGNIDLRQIKSDARQGDANTLLTWEGDSSPATGSLVKIGATGGADELPLSGIATEYVDGTGAFSTPTGGTGTVTHTGGALTADLPVFGAGSADIKVGTKSGNTDEVATSTGAKTAGHLAAWDADGNLMAEATPSDATQFLNGAATPAFAQVKDSDLSTSDVTTNNVGTSKHGFAPKGSGSASQYLDGTGSYSTPTGAGSIPDVTHSWGIVSATSPPTSGWAWVNQGSAAFAQVDTALCLHIPDNASANWRMYVRGALSGSYTIISHCISTFQAANSQALGLYLYDSSGGSFTGIELLTQSSSNQNLRVQRMNSVTSASTTPATLPVNVATYTQQTVLSFKVVEDTTHRTWYYSFDRGLNWYELLQEATNAFVTPNQAGFGGISVTSVAGNYLDVSLLSWSGV